MTQSQLGFFTPTDLSNETLIQKQNDSMQVDESQNENVSEQVITDLPVELDGNVDTTLLNSSIQSEFKTKSHEKLIADIYNLYLESGSENKFICILEQNYYMEKVSLRDIYSLKIDSGTILSIKKD